MGNVKDGQGTKYVIPPQGPVDTSEVLMLHLFLRWGPSAVQLVEYTNYSMSQYGRPRRNQRSDISAYCTSSQRKPPHSFHYNPPFP